MQLLTPILPDDPPANPPPAPHRADSAHAAIAAAHASPVNGTAIPGHRTALPDGTPVLMTISRKVILSALFDRVTKDAETGEERLISWSFPQSTKEDLIVLWLCTHTPEDWNTVALYPVWLDGPENLPTYCALPLYQRATDFFATVEMWADESCLSQLTPREIQQITDNIWGIAHATKAEPVEDEKKTEAAGTATPEPPPTGPTNTPTSSPAETPADTTT